MTEPTPAPAYTGTVHLPDTTWAGLAEHGTTFTHGRPARQKLCC
ncbi:MAG: hypothetical protein R3D55_23335 [Chloroflexota bacterium]